MSIRFLNPHNVSHGGVSIAKCREVTLSNRASDVRSLFGDGSCYAERVAPFRVVCEIHVVTEDVITALAITPGADASFSFNMADAEGGDDRTINGSHAVYAGPVEKIEKGKPGPGLATMRFVCRSSNGSDNPITIT